jgi:hypothetical protein
VSITVTICDTRDLSRPGEGVADKSFSFTSAGKALAARGTAGTVIASPHLSLLLCVLCSSRRCICSSVLSVFSRMGPPTF